jgi:hypothetical protein
MEKKVRLDRKIAIRCLHTVLAPNAPDFVRHTKLIRIAANMLDGLEDYIKLMIGKLQHGSRIADLRREVGA